MAYGILVSTRDRIHTPLQWNPRDLTLDHQGSRRVPTPFQVSVLDFLK